MGKTSFPRIAALLAAVWMVSQGMGALAYSVSQSTVETMEDSRLTGLYTLVEKQAFATEDARQKAVDGVHYLISGSRYAAIGGSQFPYSNSGGYVTDVEDGIYQVTVKAAGCYAYSKYASYVIYGEFGEKLYPWAEGEKISHTSQLTGDILRDFLLRYAQAGEHLRLDGVHSVTFLAGDEEGFYFTEYSSDSDPFIRLRYVTYEDFAASAQKENTGFWLLDINPLENEENSGESHPETEEPARGTVLLYLGPDRTQTVTLTVQAGQPLGPLPTPQAVEGAVFAGWYTDELGGQQVTQDTVFQGTASLVLYPRYQLVSSGDRYTVTLYNQETMTPFGICQAVNGDVWSLPEPEMEGYAFAGWYDGEGRLYRNGETIALGSDMTLYAFFEKAPGQKVITLQIGNPVMTIDGVEQSIDSQGTVPVLRQDRTLMPVRAVIEGLGGTVAWDNDTRTVSLTMDGRTLFLQIGSGTAWDGTGAQFALDSPPILLNDRTMLPIRFVVEYFGGTVSWMGEKQMVEIVG